ncbi:putative signal transducing protein [Stenotrophomonas humi]
MQLVYQTNNLFDAHLVKHALEDAGIPAFVFGESLLGAGGELPLFGMLRVCVPDMAKPEADEVVAALALDNGPPDPISDDDEAPGFLPA